MPEVNKNKSITFESIFNAAPDAMVIVDAGGKIVFSNNQTIKFFGYQQEELLGQPVEILMPLRYHDKHQSHRTNYIANPHTRPMGSGLELYGRHKNGSEFPVEISLSPLKTDEGILALAAIRDVTERKIIDKLKNEFISIVNHELRTPLTSIHGSISLLLGEVVAPLPVEVIRLLQIAKQNSERLVRLINDILDIEKLELGKLEFDLKPLDVERVIEEAIGSLQEYGRQFSVSLVFKKNLSSSAVFVFADYNRLLQVLSNLLTNAIKFAKPDSDVVVELSQLSDMHIRVSVTNQGEEIPEEFQSRVFQKFAQAEMSINRKNMGTGLGLSICKAIIDKFKGKIAFKTKVHEGTTFYFELPNYYLTDTDKLKVYNKINTLLVCESDTKLAGFFKDAIEQHGYRVVVSSTTAEMKSLLASQKVDGIILDLIQPNQDGIELLKEIKLLEETSLIPIIIVSLKQCQQREKGKPVELRISAFSILEWVEKPDEFLNTMQKLEKHIGFRSPQILHVESDEILGENVAQLLRNDAQIIQARTLKAAYEALATGKVFDLVILAIVLADGSGLELLAEISSRHIPVIIFSNYDLPKKYGHYVNHFLPKATTSFDELIRTIQLTLKTRNAQSRPK